MPSTHYQHGQLKCGTILVNDIDQAVELYSQILSQESVEETEITSSLALSWGAPKLEGARSLLLQPAGIDRSNYVGSSLRLIQSAEPIEPTPHATSYGWCAFELSVKDVFALAEKIQGSRFAIVGPPKRLDGISNVIPMQVVGPDQEVLFLNQVLSSSDQTDLPTANAIVDQFFIAVLASADMDAVAQEYCQQLALNNIDTHDIRYSLINRAFGLDPDTKHRLSVLHKGRRPLLEVDQYPIQAVPRKVVEGSLPLGNAMVSIVVSNLDRLPLSNTITDVQQHDSLLYGNSRSVVVRGSSNELIELIEHQQ